MTTNERLAHRMVSTRLQHGFLGGGMGSVVLNPNSPLGKACPYSCTLAYVIASSDSGSTGRLRVGSFRTAPRGSAFMEPVLKCLLRCFGHMRCLPSKTVPNDCPMGCSTTAEYSE
jgi:hypothetical protein